MKSGTSRHSASRDQAGQSPSSPGSQPDRDANRASASEVRSDLVDATQYDLDRLERAVRSLVVQQQSLKRENDELRQTLTGRDEEVSRLTSELKAVEERRRVAIGKVDALIDELDRLDSALDRSMSDSAGQIVDPARDESTTGDAAG